jgi:hypothetical protein
LLLIAIAPLALFAQTSAAPASAKITAAAVWQPPQTFLTTAKETCDKSGGPASFPACFINQMSAAGAPADAVAFTRMLFKQTDGEVGIMSAFKSVGPVDEAQVFYPLRANTNYGLLLVNGDPAVLDIDNLKQLDRKGMEENSMYQAIKRKFTQADLWPDDRSGASPWARVEPIADGGKQFVIPYLLINGCHACERVGVARYGWQFDAKGKFLGAKYISTPPPPKLTRPVRQPGTTPAPHEHLPQPGQSQTPPS